MMSPSPLQVRIVSSVELHRPLDGVSGGGIRRWRRPPFSRRTRFGYWWRHRCHPREVPVVMVVLLVMVVVVMVVHVQVRRRVQTRASHRLVLGAADLWRLHLDVGHLERLVLNRGKHIVRVHDLVHLEPRRLLRFVRMMAVYVRVHHRPGTLHWSSGLEKVAHDRLVSGLDCMLIFYHQTLQHGIEVRSL